MRTFTLAVMAVLLLACDSAGQRSPQAEDVLRNYLDAIAAGQFERAHHQLAAVDQQSIRPEGLAERMPRRGEYRLGAVRRYPDITTVEVTFAGPSEPRPASSRPGATPAPPAPGFRSFTLVREPQGWKVLLSAEMPTDGPLSASAAPVPGPAAPPSPSTPDPDTKPAPDRDVDARDQPPPVAATARGVEVYDLKAGYHRTALGRTVPGVEFKLRNRNTASALQVAVTVYFQDRHGQTISEETYYPVRSDGAGFLNTAPLKPGYLWQLERGKFFLAEAVPSEWQRGAVSAEITRLRFAGENAVAGSDERAGIP